MLKQRKVCSTTEALRQLVYIHDRQLDRYRQRRTGRTDRTAQRDGHVMRRDRTDRETDTDGDRHADRTARQADIDRYRHVRTGSTDRRAETDGQRHDLHDLQTGNTKQTGRTG